MKPAASKKVVHWFLRAANFGLALVSAALKEKAAQW